jgi:SNF family Na+-dependent transporter
LIQRNGETFLLQTTRAGFILATLGSAIGLGNVWRFSYVAGENGGGAFLLVYLGAVLVVGVPLLLGELALGRHTLGGIAIAILVGWLWGKQTALQSSDLGTGALAGAWLFTLRFVVPAVILRSAGIL